MAKPRAGSISRTGSGNAQENADIRNFLIVLAQSEDPDISRRAFELSARRYPDEDWKKTLPKVFQQLLHGDPKQQLLIRKSYYQSTGETPGKLVMIDALVDYLTVSDHAEPGDRLAAIRALGAFGRIGNPNESRAAAILNQIVQNGSLDEKTAAVVALRQLHVESPYANHWLAGNESVDSAGKKRSQLEIQSLIDKESEAAIGDAPRRPR